MEALLGEYKYVETTIYYNKLQHHQIFDNISSTKDY